MNCLTSASEPFVFSGRSCDMEVFSQLSILRTSLWKSYYRYLLICSFLCLMNIYGAVAVHHEKNQVSILQMSVRSSKGKERQEVMDAEMEYCTEKRHLLKKGDGG